MKKLFSLILIAGFLFPALGHAATVATTVSATDIASPALQDKTLSDKKTAVTAALTQIYSQLNNLSDQTQTAIDQLNTNGVTTDNAQTILMEANASLVKAKNDIDTFGTIDIPASKNGAAIALDMMKYTAATTETSLRDAKAHLIDTLTSLKAALPGLNAQ